MHTTNVKTFFFKKLPDSFYACLSIIGGICIQIAGIPYYGLLSIAMGLFFLQQRYALFPQKHLFILCCFMFIGMGRFAHYVHPYEQAFKNLNPQPTTITGIITDSMTHPHGRYKKSYILKANTPGIAGMNIQIYSNDPFFIAVGDTVAVQDVILKKPTSSSYLQYLIKEGILCSIFTKNSSISLRDRPSWSLIRSIKQYRQNLLRAIKQKSSYQTFSFFSALFLGEKSGTKAYLDRVSDQFKEWGIVHFLARSGLHLVIFVVLWEFMLALIPIHFFYKQLIMLGITCSYVLLSWSSISFVRALVSFIFYKYSHALYRPTHFLHIVCATCCIILIVNPIQLFFLDFQLTFLLTGALAWLALDFRTQA